MQLTRFILLALIVTLLASFYIHQQIMILQLAYEEQQNLAYLSDLQDANNKLKYQIYEQTSLAALAKIWQEESFEWPDRKQLVNLPLVSEDSRGQSQMQESRNPFLRFLRSRSLVEATPAKRR